MAIAPSPIQTLTAQEVSHVVITAAMKVHSELGAGLLEKRLQDLLGVRTSTCGIGLRH